MLESSSAVALVKHFFGSTVAHVMAKCAEASMPCVQVQHADTARKREAAILYIRSLARHVELRNTPKNLARAHPGEFQVPCDIDLRSDGATPIQLCIKSNGKVLQLHFRWVALIKVVGWTGATFFVIQKNSRTIP